MKKSFFYLAAGALALTACTSEEVLDESSVHSNAIGFENVVSKQTRAALDGAEINNDNLDQFCVFGYYTKTGLEAHAIQVFNDEVVSKDKDGVWGYANTRYWVPGATYQFYAYSCGDIKLSNTLGTFSVDFNQADDSKRVFTIDNYKCDNTHQHDLIFAKSEKIVGQEKDGGNATVKFKFSHLLAKIDAQFTTDLPEDYSIEVYDVMIDGIINKGDYDSYTNSWSDLASIDDIEGRKSKVVLRTVEPSSEEGKENNFITVKKGQADTDKPKTKLAFVLPFNYQGSDVKTKLSFRMKVIKDSEENTVLDRLITGSWEPKWELGHSYTYNIKITGDVAHLDAIEFGVSGVDTWETGEASTTIDFNTELNESNTTTE